LVSSIKPATTLNGLRVLVTRATTQAKPLCQLIKQSGGKALHYPMLELQATPGDTSITRANAQLAHYDKLIFISANAVQFGFDTLDSTALNKQQFACVGQQTANALSQQGYTDILQPEQDFSSEGLLNLSAFQDVKAQRILIVRGKGGRELLKQKLEQRGAKVDYLECYRRLLPQIDYSPLRHHIRQQSVDVISCSSNQALEHLLLAAPEPQLFNIAFLPISTAMATKAKQAGFNHIINTANNASDAAILESLYHFAANNHWERHERQRPE
jgi:uroporphyrinogen-III synthase